jgi:glycosyltransferase involved in cell wall biosynthesis
LGEEGFRALAARLLSRSVGSEEVAAWLDDEDPPSLFVEPVLARAAPVIVHTRRYRDLLAQRYAAETELATFPANLFFFEDELIAPSRRRMRQRLGIADDTFLVSTFGFVAPGKAPSACIEALAILRAGGVSAELRFVGDAGPWQIGLQAAAAEQGLGDVVHLEPDFVPEQRYRDLLIASDAAIQLRTYDYGQPSAALADAISAGLPAVATACLAAACDAPSYVRAVPDDNPPAAIAAALAAIHHHRHPRLTWSDERRTHGEEHSFERYAERLSEILALR